MEEIKTRKPLNLEDRSGELEPLVKSEDDNDQTFDTEKVPEEILLQTEKESPKKQDSQEQQKEQSQTTTVVISSPFSSLNHFQSLSVWKEWLYPSDIPRECHLLRVENLAVPMCYLLVGLLQGLSGPLINVYPIDLNATEAQQTSIASIRSLPASCKILFGFVSDNFPLFGYRRKSYMLLGWLLSSCSILTLLLSSDTSLSYSNNNNMNAYQQSCSIQNTYSNDNDFYNSTNSNPDDDTEEGMNYDNDIVIPENAPSMPFLSLCLLGFGLGFWFADVMGDSIVAEKAKLEPLHSRGQLQSTCYAYRFFGVMIAAPISTWLYDSHGPGSVFWLLVILPLMILPLIYWLNEATRVNDIPSTQQQCHEIYKAVCSRAVWQPMAFVYLYNVLQIGNAAWRQFLKTALHFTSCQLNMLFIVSTVLVYLGILCYKYYMIHWSWRNVYIGTTLLNTAFSSLQLLLLFDITFGLSYFLFALGDDVFFDFIAGVQFLPLTIMMVHLCPSGSEGATYAMFTTLHNVAMIVSTSISTTLLDIWDVSKKAISQHDYSGMIKLTILTTALQTCGILFVGWLPHNKEELETLKNGCYHSSHVGGIIFLSIILVSLFHAIKIGVLNIVAPGWMGES